MFFVSASRMTGTSRPRSVSTATPMLTYFLKTISSAARSIDALNCGNTLQRRRDDLHRDRRDRQLAAGRFDLLRVLLPQLLERRDVGLVVLRDVRNRAPTPRSGARPSSAGRRASADARPRPTARSRAAARAAGAGAAAPAPRPLTTAASRAPSRPRSRCARSAPVPGTSSMSTPSSRAMRRTDGAAGAGGVSAAAAPRSDARRG